LLQIHPHHEKSSYYYLRQIYGCRRFFTLGFVEPVKGRDKGFEVKLLGTKPSHRSSCGIDLPIHGMIEECNDADLVFFASGSGVRDAIKDRDFLDRFNLNPDKQVICSMCSGALILAELGLLNGLSATTYPSVFEMLRGYGVEVLEDTHLVTHGNIGTAAGCLAAVDLMRWGIEKLYDAQIAEDVIASVLPVGQGQVCMY
jgi:transcriptional regulator GlxA family with amidase domain